MYTHLGDTFANKKADLIFFKANAEEDNTISSEEFSEMIRQEYEK